jgi:hypothetical protein
MNARQYSHQATIDFAKTVECQRIMMRDGEILGHVSNARITEDGKVMGTFKLISGSEFEVRIGGPGPMRNPPVFIEEENTMEGNNCAAGPHQELWLLFHQLWTSAVDSDDYDKEGWKKLQRSILGLMQQVPDTLTACTFTSVANPAPFPTPPPPAFTS